MPFVESTRVCDQTRESVIKHGIVGFDFNKFGRFQLSVSKERVTSNSRFKRDQKKKNSQKQKVVTSKIKTKGLELFKELAFQSILPQRVDIYNPHPTKKQDFRNICSNQAKQLLKF